MITRDGTNISTVLDDITIERERRLRGILEPDTHALVLWSRALAALPSDLERERLTAAFQFAKKIKYSHAGLTSEIYFSHPLRVSAMALLIGGAQDTGVGVLAILHNVLEVSEVSVGKLAEVFGKELSEQIVALTVDRNIQWDRTYKTAYYRNLMAGPRSTRLVKIFDKLDNLFVLGLNPDDGVRAKYLFEIEDFVLPMVEATLPELVTYMTNLVDDCRAIGFIKSPVANNTKENI